MGTLTQLKLRLPKVYEKPIIPYITSDFYRRLARPTTLYDMQLELILIYGIMGVGKSVMQNTIAGHIRRLKGAENVNCIMSKSYRTLNKKMGLDGNEKLRKCPYNVLILDDPFDHQQSWGGRTKEIQEVISNHLKIRHRAEEVTGLDTGRVYTIMGPQQIKGFEKSLRRAKIQIFLESLGPEEHDTVLKLLNNNKQAYDLLLKLEDLKDEDNRYKSYGIAKIGSYKIGLIYLPPSDEQHYTYFDEYIMNKEEQEKQKEEIVERWKDHFRKLPHFDPLEMEQGEVNDRYLVELKNLYYSGEISFEERNALISKKFLLFAELREEKRNKYRELYEVQQQELNEELKASKLSFNEYLLKRISEEHSEKHAKIIEYTMSGLTQSEIAKKLGMSQQAVSKMLKTIRQSYLGYYFEDWFCGKDGITSTAGNKSEVDYKHNDQIKSLKCFCKDGAIFINPVKECQPEVQEAMKEKKQFTIVVCNLKWKPIKNHFIQETEGLDPLNLPTIQLFPDRNIIYNYTY